MTNLSLDDQLKQAQVEKTQAEALKLKREAEAAVKQAHGAFWSDMLKLAGGIILGIGGVVAAITQYEVAELKVKNATQELEQLEKEKKAVEAAKKEALEMRDAALQEFKDKEQAVNELKKNLAQLTSDMQTAKPELLKTRLVYVQYSDDVSRDVINELTAYLGEKKFNAPGAERVSGKYQNMVKYFQSADSTDAGRLAKAVEDFYASKGCPVTMRVVPAQTATGAASPLEVWLSNSCKG
jgi:vacuolar-type H+-ATPase subunit I/STV1